MDAAKPMSARRGMTLAEVLVAMMLLTTVVFALGGFTAKFAQAASQARLMINANEIAATRLDMTENQPTYTAIDSMDSGARRDTVKTDFTAFYRTTKVRRVGGALTDSVDYKIVTVSVSHPGMKKVVAKSVAMAAF